MSEDSHGEDHRYKWKVVICPEGGFDREYAELVAQRLVDKHGMH